MLPILDKLALRQTSTDTLTEPKQPVPRNEHTGTPSLPEELLKYILAFGDCQSIKEVCNSSKETKKLCNDVTIFDQANARSGFYPANCEKWAQCVEILTDPANRSKLAILNDTAFAGLLEIGNAKEFFEFACDSISKLRNEAKFKDFHWWHSSLPSNDMIEALSLCFGNQYFYLLNVSLELYGEGVTTDPLVTRRTRPSDVLKDHHDFFALLNQRYMPINKSQTRHSFFRSVSYIRHTHRHPEGQRMVIPPFEAITSKHAYECLKTFYNLKWVYDPIVFGQPTLAEMYRSFLRKYYQLGSNSSTSPNDADQAISWIANDHHEIFYDNLNQHLRVIPESEDSIYIPSLRTQLKMDEFKRVIGDFPINSAGKYIVAMNFVDKFETRLAEFRSWNDASESDTATKIDAVLFDMKNVVWEQIQQYLGPGVFEMLERLVLIRENSNLIDDYNESHQLPD
jgi:hypothetical protein